MSDEVTIEVVSEQADVDWGELHHLLNACFAYMQGRVDPPSSLTKMSVEDLKRKAQVETLIVARKSGNLVGTAYCREEGASICVKVEENLIPSGLLVFGYSVVTVVYGLAIGFAVAWRNAVVGYAQRTA